MRKGLLIAVTSRVIAALWIMFQMTKKGRIQVFERNMRPVTVFVFKYNKINLQSGQR